MDENNTYINKSEKEALEIMENVSDITSDQLQALRENEECFQTCSDIAELPCESCENVGVIQNWRRVYNKNRVLFMM